MTDLPDLDMDRLWTCVHGIIETFTEAIKYSA
jgi:hypothetical protein